MGVIDSLSAGYRFLGRRIELLIIPVLIDLAIWFLPRLSMGTLFGQLADLYGAMAATEGMPSELAEMATQVSPFVAEYGNATNLWRMLANQTLVHVPSMMRVMGPMPGQGVIQIGSWPAVVAIFFVLGALALLLGVIYLTMLAQRLPIGHSAKAASAGTFASDVMGSWAKIMGFVILLGLGLMTLYLAVNILAIPILLFLPAVATALAFGLFVLTFLALVFFYFVTAGIVLDKLSIREGIAHSVMLVRSNFVATLFFILVTNLIAVGFSIILSSIGRAAPVGTVTAILVNAYIGTGLAMALLVFYRTRWLKLVGAPEALYEPSTDGSTGDSGPGL